MYKCDKCPKKYKSRAWLDRHKDIVHPAPPAPAPKRETIFAANRLPQTHTLLGAKKTLDIGDVFYRVEKHVIKKITFTEGSIDVEVQSEITKSNWQKDKPL